MFTRKLDDFAYYELKRIFDDTPDWIHKMQVRNLGFFARVHYKFFVKVMSFRMDLTLRKLKKLQRNFSIQERAFVILSSKILFTDKFNDILKNSVHESEKLLKSIQKELEQWQTIRKS